MNTLLFNLSQTPIKPIHPAWLRCVCEYSVTKNLLKLQSFSYEDLYYVDDTSLQVAKLLSHLDISSVPNENIGFYLGKQYVEANKAVTKEEAGNLKLQIEQNPPKELRNVLQASLVERFSYIKFMNVDFGPSYFESDHIAEISDLFDLLKSTNNILDTEKYTESIFLDATNDGIPLLTLKGKNGYTYLAKTLTAIYKLSADKEVIIYQAIDEEQDLLRAIKWFVEKLDKKLILQVTGRVKIGDSAASSRFGGWEDYTFDKVYERYKHVSKEDFSIALKLYYLGKYSDEKRFSFSFEELDYFINLSEKINATLSRMSNIKADLSELIESENKDIRVYSKKLLSQSTLESPSSVAKGYMYLFNTIKKTSEEYQNDLFSLLNIYKKVLYE